MTISSTSPNAYETLGPAGVVPLNSPQPTPRLIVDLPPPGPLSFDRVVIQYRAENLRIQPVFGERALDVSPRIGHIHVTIDDLQWHWADASGEPLILNGFTPGPQKVMIQLGNANHAPFTSDIIQFVVPAPAAAGRP